MALKLKERRQDKKLRDCGFRVTCASHVNYMLMKIKRHGDVMSVKTPQSKVALMMEYVVSATLNTSTDENSNKKLRNTTISNKVYFNTPAINNKMMKL
jgi:hypothetical protein